jgi:hypothetical protein
VQPRYFREALDRFAQFFIAPLLTKDVIQREREAVESGKCHMFYFLFFFLCQQLAYLAIMRFRVSQ